MKVILLKDTKEGKANQIIEVSDGYATNFLIKNKLALPLNAKTNLVLNKKIEQIQQDNVALVNNAKIIKDKIEKLHLIFSLNMQHDQIFGSITRKQILKELLDKHIKISSHAIQNIQIRSIGVTNIEVELHKEVVANLKVEVRANGN